MNGGVCVMPEYVELASDHAFTAFLATMTPRKALRDRERSLSVSERKRQKFLVEKSRVEDAVRRSRARRLAPVIAPDRQLEIALAALEKQDALKGQKAGMK